MQCSSHGKSIRKLWLRLDNQVSQVRVKVKPLWLQDVNEEPCTSGVVN